MASVDVDLRDNGARWDASFHRVGVTGRLGAVVALPDAAQAGVEGGLGVRYALREPPPSGEVYFSPALSFLLTGGLVMPTGARNELAPLQGVPTRLSVGNQKSVGADARIELMVARHTGQLLPDFAAWVTTGGAALIDEVGVRPSAHVGIGLSIDFIRDWVGTLGKMGGGGNWGSGWGSGLGHLGNLGGGGGGAGVALLAIVVVPLAIVAAIGAVFVASLAASMATVELRYTVLPTDRGGVGGYGSLLVGCAI